MAPTKSVIAARVVRVPVQMTSKLNPDLIRHIWHLPDSMIPAVHSDRWEDIIPSNFRAAAMAVENPVPVGETRPRTLGCADTLPLLMAVGEALLWACFDPALRFSIVGRRLVYAFGVTILLIQQRRDGEIITVPWSMGESRKTVVKRMIAMRKWPAPALTAQEAYIAANLLPRCQAAVSVVAHLNIEQPTTNILASGGECPISIVVGRRSVHFSLDHRIYDPSDASTLYTRLCSRIPEIVR